MADTADNPATRWLMERMFGQVDALMRPLAPRSVLHARCAEGQALRTLTLPEAYLGIDPRPANVERCRKRDPRRRFEVQSPTALPYADASFDVVVATQVLEELEDPALAVAELSRVAERGVIFSVPNEPIFQVGNAARGKYLDTLGDHPAHLQHWGRWSFPKFLVGTGAVRDLKLRTVGPWIVVLARPAR